MTISEWKCPEFHSWFIILRDLTHLRLKCKFCAQEAKVHRYSDVTPTEQVDHINADPESRRDPERFPLKSDDNPFA